ncbi:MAG TPA: hypothetical protein VMS56_14515 [Thermoanaerobaculia bacterium]|nr:hypothetical protein [Thermoanaerobaculia bacterium]
MTRRLAASISIGLILLAGGAFGQETAAAPQTAAPAQTTTLAGMAADREVVRDLERLLRAHPAELSAILRLDPSLLASPSLLEKYPELAALVERHPELARHPRIHVDGANLPAPPVVGSTIPMVVEAIAFIITIFVFVLAGMWLIRTVLEQRRWSRLAKVQSEVHGKLLDRLTSSEELHRYMQSPAGMRFLESAPIPVRADMGGAAPVASILWSLQIGIVVAAGSIGLLLVAGSFGEASPQVNAMGVIGVCVGVGFAGSAVVSAILSKRLGAWQSEPAGRTGSE